MQVFKAFQSWAEIDEWNSWLNDSPPSVRGAGTYFKVISLINAHICLAMNIADIMIGFLIVIGAYWAQQKRRAPSPAGYGVSRENFRFRNTTESKIINMSFM